MVKISQGGKKRRRMVYRRHVNKVSNVIKGHSQRTERKNHSSLSGSTTGCFPRRVCIPTHSSHCNLASFVPISPR